MSRHLLEVSELEVCIGRGSNPQRVVDCVSFTLSAGETLAVVGESGSGKSLMAKAVAGLLPPLADSASTAPGDSRGIDSVPAEARCARAQVWPLQAGGSSAGRCLSRGLGKASSLSTSPG